jgi:hypothetical protein
MAEAKISIVLGGITFSGEGEEGWLASQLDKVLEKAATIPAARVRQTGDDAGSETPDTSGDTGGGEAGTLASYLTGTKSGANQVRRFLATAEWLHKKGNKRVKTVDVTKALQDNHQKRLSNPADCLGQNVGKGHCEKVGKEFFVTDDGRTALATG